jgi:hypothetical protein
MSSAPDNDGKKSNPPSGHELQYVLAAGLIGAVLLLILLVIFLQY